MSRMLMLNVHLACILDPTSTIRFLPEQIKNNMKVSRAQQLKVHLTFMSQVQITLLILM